jgi:hypothetical protein
MFNRYRRHVLGVFLIVLVATSVGWALLRECSTGLRVFEISRTFAFSDRYYSL